MRVTLKAISKRGKDRINSHGNVFNLIRRGKAGLQENPDSILVTSLHETDKDGKWLGWFEVGKEVEIINEFIEGTLD